MPATTVRACRISAPTHATCVRPLVSPPRPPENAGTDIVNNDRVRIPFDHWADLIYASAPFVGNNIPSAGGRTSDNLECEAILDFLDLRLTGGRLKAAWPVYDPSDDDSDPLTDWTGNPNDSTSGDGDPANDVDARTPREWIIWAIDDSFGDGSTNQNNRVNKFRTALYLFSQTPEFQVKK